MIIKRFRLAKMSYGLTLMTSVALFVPPIILLAAYHAPLQEIQMVLGWTGGLLVLAYAAVWFWWRPIGFDVGRDELAIVWPSRIRTIHKADIVSVQMITNPEFREAYGRGMRIGAGGLWGGFGLFKTRGVTFSMWISRIDHWVIVKVKRGRPLLITPSQPERFIAAVDALRRGDL